MRKFCFHICFYFLVLGYAVSVGHASTKIEKIRGVVQETVFSDPDISNPYNFQIGILVVKTVGTEKVYRFPIFNNTALRDAQWRRVNILSLHPGDTVEVEFVVQEGGVYSVRFLLALDSKEWADGQKFRNNKNYR